VELTREDYYGNYLGFDDRDCFAAVMRDHGIEHTGPQLAEMTAAKTKIVQRRMRESIEPLPGVIELIRAAAGTDIPMAVCSGALRAEIELAATAIGVRERFCVIVAAEDVARGKPDPEGFRLALRRLGEALGRSLAPARCVVCEDSPAGIAAAKAAGMNVLAVETSYPPDALAQADRTVHRLSDVTLDDLRTLVG
jgi:HAD superfamily hydrolase (TIGR01509 family)